ncbi:MAG: helix-turn-helix transcriptional regulator [Salana multivorans]|uniref:helix-turn-helix domain-containing protein n=1 Tax=Salana multivorans TaxID=120377 RepID=UPI001ACA5D83|nr:helix-turn-helix transcriptional regulator [Salana multivorans]MBN8883003.1 helix-turn-helix transcriptional regulator [Salana multivorans]
MPATIARRTYPPVQPIREGKTPPHVSLGVLRQALGLTLQQVADRIAEAVPEMSDVSRGTLSAIESGSRGVSDLMVIALERAYGLPEGSITTAYAPRPARGKVA